MISESSLYDLHESAFSAEKLEFHVKEGFCLVYVKCYVYVDDVVRRDGNYFVDALK